MKAKKIISLVLFTLPTLVMLFSAYMKFAAPPEVVEGFAKSGLLPTLPLPLLATIELGCITLFWIPRTSRIGFFLLCSYLGGAGVIEITRQSPPAALILLTFFWIGAYLKDDSLFGLNAKAETK